MSYQDGTFTSAVQDGPASPFYPLLVGAVSDPNTKGTIRNMVVLPANYSPLALKTADPSDNTQYLMAESQPSIEGGIARFQRTYCRVPGDRVWYTSRVLTKPTTASAGGVGNAAFIVYDTLAAGVNLGLYTTYSTMIFAPNSKIYGPIKVCTSSNSGGNTRLEFASPHGVAGTEQLLVAGAAGSANRYGIVEPAGYTVIDTDTIDILGFNLGANSTSIAEYLRDYTPGTARVGARMTQSFWLPGVTAGVNVGSDIPIPNTLLSDQALLDNVIATVTGYVNYDATDLELWNGWPIYTQTITAINTADL